jgi:hypothetical protein
MMTRPTDRTGNPRTSGYVVDHRYLFGGAAPAVRHDPHVGTQKTGNVTVLNGSMLGRGRDLGK